MTCCYHCLRCFFAHIAPLRACAFFTVLLLFLAAVPGAHAQHVIRVQGLDIEENPGDGVCSLREAIHNANADADLSGGDCPAGQGADVIEVFEYETYTVYDGPYDASGRNGLPPITSDVTLVAYLGAADAEGARILRDPAAEAFRLFYVAPSGKLTLIDITVQGGRTHADLHGEHCSGGGIYVAPGGALVLNGSEVVENESGCAVFPGEGGMGGGIYVGAGASLDVTWAVITGNAGRGRSLYGRGGGGLYLGPRASLQATSLTLRRNSSEGSGGGLYADSNATVVVERASVEDNMANSRSIFGWGYYGGGLYLGPEVVLQITGGEVLRNRTTAGGASGGGARGYGGGGGGLYVGKQARAELSEVTISLNITGEGASRPIKSGEGGFGGDGGGVYADSAAVVELVRSDVNRNVTGDGGSETGPDYGAGRAGDGGGIYAAPASSLTLEATTVQSNVTGKGGAGIDGGIGGSGGGVYIAGRATVTGGSRIWRNQVGNSRSYAAGEGGPGGGLYLASTGTLLLTESAVEENIAGDGSSQGLAGGGGPGGGLYVAGRADIDRSTIRGNRAGDGGERSGDAGGGSGGGLYVAGSVIITASTISGNAAGDAGAGGYDEPGDGGAGGGIFSTGTVELYTSTVSGNRAGKAAATYDRTGEAGGGGGIASRRAFSDPGPSVLHVVSSTITGNHSEGLGGGLDAEGTATLLSTILLGNSAAYSDDCFARSDGLTSLGYNLLEEGGGCPTVRSDVTLALEADMAAVIGELGDHGGPTETHPLPQGSPAVDAGTCEAGTDQRGELRPAGAACDIGAFELQGSLLPADLVAYWPLDEDDGLLTADASEGGHNGLLQNYVYWVPGRYGAAVAFDGSGRYVSVEDAPALRLTEAVTLAAWMQPRAESGDNATGIQKYQAYRLLVQKGAEARWMFDFWDAKGKFHRITSQTAVPYDQWHHVAATFDGRRMRLYLDGKLDAEARVNAAMRPTPGGFELGRRDGDKYFAGSIDEVYLFNKALTGDEVRALLDGTAAKTVVATGTEASTEVPLAYALESNYPNPFNPSTTIGFRLPEAAPVRLEVFDVLGRRVATLVRSELPAGVHEVRWDGRSEAGQMVAGSVYVYRLQAGSFTQSRSMVLLK